MTENELNLWQRYAQQDEAARKELILLYLPLADLLARRIARAAGARWEDLRQDAVIGLIKAVARFDPAQGVPFSAFAKYYIRGAIFDSPELTRDLARRQEEVYRKVRQTEAALAQALQRTPTIEEVAERAGLTVEQIRSALDARGIAFAGALPVGEDMPAWMRVEVPTPERALFLMEALARLSEREQEIIRLFYWEDQPREEIARQLGLTVSNVTKIRQRALGRLRRLLGVERKGGQDEDGRSGE